MTRTVEPNRLRHARRYAPSGVSGTLKSRASTVGHLPHRLNRRHRRSGHLFGGRFSALLVTRESHMLELSRYVALNPERVAVPIERYGRYPWRRYRATAGLAPAPAFLAHEPDLELFSDDRAQAVRSYRAFVRAGLARRDPKAERVGEIFSARSTSPVAGACAVASRRKWRVGSERRSAVRSRSSYATETTPPSRSPTERATRCESWRPSSASTARRSAGGCEPRSGHSASAEAVAPQDRPSPWPPAERFSFHYSGMQLGAVKMRAFPEPFTRAKTSGLPETVRAAIEPSCTGAFASR